MIVLWCRHASFLQHMEQEVAFFKAQALHERSRAEVAIAELLLLKTGTPALAPNLVHAVTDAERKAGDLLANPEFAQAGLTE